MIKKRREKKPSSISRQLRTLLFVVIIPLTAVIVVLFGMLISFNSSYANIMHNATLAGQLNSQLKSTIDSEVYYYIVKGTKEDELPRERVAYAREIFKKLEKTTTIPDNQWRLKSMKSLCNRLDACMTDIEKAQIYDKKMNLYNLDIQSITNLIEKYLSEYIFEEISHSAEIQKVFNQGTMNVLAISAMLIIAIVVFLVCYSTKFTKGITEPVWALCKKSEQILDNDFVVEPLQASIVEIEQLDTAFNDMAGRLGALIDNVKKNQEALRKAEMELLQAQINPHFLYNTFDSVIWLAEMQRHDEVVTIVTSLSTFFRNSLSKGQDIISLAAETEQVESYMKIQKIRYRDILEYEIDIPDELGNCTIPKLTLQPLAENAIYHGIKHKRGKGTIRISACSVGDDIEITVSDNGAGMNEDKLSELKAGIYEDKHTGLGLINVHKRIKLYCGETYGLKFESESGKGTCVIVKIPKKIAT